MDNILGWLAWWRVGAVQIAPDDAAKMMTELGLPAPNPIIPIDAFRRLTGSARHSYDLEDGHIATLELYAAKSQGNLLVRHIVLTVRLPVRQGSINVSSQRVGEAAFYKPPRGKPHKARMRVQVNSDDPNVQAFASELRLEYATALRTLDDQGARRMIRSYLSSVDALLIDGVYFLEDEGKAKALRLLVDGLGGTSRCNLAPLVDGPMAQRMLTDARARKPDEGDADGED